MYQHNHHGSSNEQRVKTTRTLAPESVEETVLGREVRPHSRKRIKATTTFTSINNEGPSKDKNCCAMATKKLLGSDEKSVHGHGQEGLAQPSVHEGQGTFDPWVLNTSGISDQQSSDYGGRYGREQQTQNVDDLDHDDSNDEADEDANHKLLDLGDTKINDRRSCQNEYVNTTFPQRLMDAIEEELSQKDEPPILKWVMNGSAFLICDKVAFERNFLPKYFSRSKCKFMSFVRKLYRWGFRQLVDHKGDATDSITFIHPQFVRGDKEGCLQMRSMVKKISQPTFLQQQGMSNLQQQYEGYDLTSKAAVPISLVFDASNSQPFLSSGLHRGLEQNDLSLLVQQVDALRQLSLQNIMASHGQYFPAPLLQGARRTLPNVFPMISAAGIPVISSIGEQHQYLESIVHQRLIQQLRETGRQQRLSMVNDSSNADRIEYLVAPAQRDTHPLPPVFLTPQRGDIFGSNHSLSTGNRISVRADPVVVLAHQIMKINPGVGVQMALDLAEKSLQGCLRR